jgi:hypothetical protein
MQEQGIVKMECKYATRGKDMTEDLEVNRMIQFLKFETGLIFSPC